MDQSKSLEKVPQLQEILEETKSSGAICGIC